MPNTSKRMANFSYEADKHQISFPFLRQQIQRWSIFWFSDEESSCSHLPIQNIHYIK